MSGFAAAWTMPLGVDAGRVRGRTVARLVSAEAEAIVGAQDDVEARVARVQQASAGTRPSFFVMGQPSRANRSMTDGGSADRSHAVLGLIISAEMLPLIQMLFPPPVGLAQKP